MGKTINFRKLAGVAISAATLLTLAPFGVANAAQGDPINIPTTKTETLTINAPASHPDQINGHEFAALRIGQYDAAAKGADAATLDSVAVGTVSGVKDAVSGALSAARSSSADKPGFENNPAGEVASLQSEQKTVPFDDNSADGSELRKFVTNMANDPTVKQLFDGSSLDKSAAAADGQATISVVPGMYLIEDVTATLAHGAADKAAIPMLVESTITDGSTTYNKIGDLTLGVVNMKVDDPFKVQKGLVSINDSPVTKPINTASVGSKLTYKLTAKVPMTTGYSKFRYVLTDHPAADGLTYQSVESVKIGDADVPDDQYTVTAGASTTDTTYSSTKYVIFDLSKAVVATDPSSANPSHRLYAVGDSIVVTYNMKLNEAVNDGNIANSVRLAYSNNPSNQPSGDLNTDTSSPDIDENGDVKPADPSNSNGSTGYVDGTDSTPGNNNNGGHETKVYTRHFSIQTRDITKKDQPDDGDNPVGAVFEVYPNSGSTDPYKFVQLPDGTYMLSQAPGSNSELTVKGDAPKQGSLKIDGLADGTYTVKETLAPSDYLNATRPTFDVTLQDDPSATPDPTKSYLTDTSDFFNLVEVFSSPVEADTHPIHVYFASNLSQLPLTGGAGIILAVLLAMALVAAAGSLYVVKRRETAGTAVAGNAKIIR